MSLRFKFIIALLTTSLLSVMLVGIVAHQRLMRQFDNLVLERAARNFRGDVASYWLTYGSWEAAQRAEPFRQFALRRMASLGKQEPAPGLRPRERGPDAAGPDLGSPSEAAALTPWSPELSASEPPPSDSGRGAPPFRFVLFDPTGKILAPPPEVGRALRPEEQQRSIPITVQGRIVAFASPIGIINHTGLDRAYLAAMWNAIGWGLAAAAAMAIGLGLLVGTRMSSSLRELTGAIRNMQDGTLRQQVKNSSRDEVGVLARALNAMSNEIAASHDRLQDQHRIISQQAEQLREQSIRDELTGLFNRRHFVDASRRMLEQAQRYDQPIAVAIGDIDHFKRINDQFSHAIGDAVLRQVGRLLPETLRSSDLVARYGGEEFVFVFPQSRLDDAAECCERLRQAIEAHPWHSIHPELRVTISIGVTADLTAGGIESMLAVADQLLYEAKLGGRNRVCRSSEQQLAATVSRVLGGARTA